MGILVKKHVSNHRMILAVCDESLLGKIFSDKGMQIDLTGSFYNGKKVDEKNLIELMAQAQIINIVGKESMDVGIKAGVVEKKSIIMVKSIPHAQCVKFV
ncbi:MAG: DUF424 family protein [Candidatus Woesearchaeota archaeon]